MKYIHGQILVAFARVLFHLTEVVSGAYKDKEILVEDKAGRFLRKLTEQELLQDSMQVMTRYIENMQDCIEHLPTE